MTRSVLLGVVIGAQGIQGEVKVKAFTGDPEAIGDYGPLTDAKAERRFRLKVRRVSKGDVVIAAIQGITDRNAAEALKGTELYVPRDALPEAGDGEFYYADLVGLRAVTADGRVLGDVVAVHNFGAGDMLEVKPEGGASVMVPFTDDAVPEVDLDGGRAVVDPAFWLDAGAGDAVERRQEEAEER